VINITNKRARQLYIAEMARLMQRLETANIRELKPILNRQYMNCARLVQQGVLDGAYHAVDMERDRLATKVALHYRRTATVFGKKAYKIINSSKGIAFPEEVKAPLDEFWSELNRWIPAQTAMKVTKMQNTSKKLLASVIQKGMQEGESHKQIASRIRSTGKISTLQRAKTIAITETHTAAVHSVDTAIKSTRIEMEKEWSASLDKRTRPDHVVADGQRVPENGVFIVGGMPMKYPGDPAGGPDQTVLCRCVLLYHTVKRMDELKPYVPEEVSMEKILKHAEKGIVENSFETAIAFDNKGVELLRRKGAASSVRFTTEEVNKLSWEDGVIFTHNHPTGISFSPDDILFMQKVKFDEIRAVGRKYLHKARLIKDVDSKSIQRAIWDCEVSVRDEFTAKILANEIIPSEASAEHWHKVWTLIEEKYDWFFYKRELR